MLFDIDEVNLETCTLITVNTERASIWGQKGYLTRYGNSIGKCKQEALLHFY